MSIVNQQFIIIIHHGQSTDGIDGLGEVLEEVQLTLERVSIETGTVHCGSCSEVGNGHVALNTVAGLHYPLLLHSTGISRTRHRRTL